MGCGQQQKVFEPIARGIPTITSSRAIAGYPLEAGKSFLSADAPEAFIEQLASLRSPARREQLSSMGVGQSRQLFSEAGLDKALADAISEAISHPRF